MRTIRASSRSAASSRGRAKTPDTLAYGSLESPVGRIWVAVSSRGVRRVALGSLAEEEFLADLRRAHPGVALRSDAEEPVVRSACRQLAEYFKGCRASFDLHVDLEGVTPFRRQVLRAAARIPRGRRLSYGLLATSIGRAKAARAVGGALSANPVPIVIPCHRVVAADGSLGGFTVRRSPRCLDIKRALLELERTGAGS